MNQNDFVIFKKCMQELSTLWRSGLSENEIKYYFNIFKDKATIEEIKSAFKFVKFDFKPFNEIKFPTPYDIRKSIEKARNEINESKKIKKDLEKQMAQEIKTKKPEPFVVLDPENGSSLDLIELKHIDLVPKRKKGAKNTVKDYLHDMYIGHNLRTLYDCEIKSQQDLIKWQEGKKNA